MTNRIRILPIFSVLVIWFIVASSPLSAEEGRAGKFSLDISAGLVGADAFDSNSAVFALTPRWHAASFERFDVAIPLKVARIPNPDPPLPEGPSLCTICPECCNPNCLSCPGSEELEGGPSWIVTPNVEIVFRPGERLRPSLFVGGGVWIEEGRSTTVEGLGTFRTSDTTRPVAAYGLNLTSYFSERWSLRLEAGAFTAFGGTMKITTPSGEKVEVEGKDVTTGLISLGLGIRFW